MWASWLNDSSIPALEQSMAFAQKRHALLAGNIANQDVPDYQTRDLSVDDFQAALKSNIQAQNAPQHRSPGSPISIDPAEKLRDVRNQVLYLDGSDVSLEQQITQINKNQSMHDTAIALMRSQFQTISAAIRESANV
jgi:flagellar basal-body rod protein FlgB